MPDLKPKDIGKYWKNIADTFTDGLLIMDTMGRFIAANRAAEKLTGYTEKELLSRDCRILNCTDCRIIGEGPGEKWCMLFSKGIVREKKCLITHKNRRTVHIIKSGTVLRDPRGEIIGAVETIRDISQIVRQQREIRTLRQAFQLDEGYYGIIGKSQVMQNLFGLIENLAYSDAPVMITGESGTGKELAALAIHDSGPRRGNPFIRVNCAALNENLLESELFGHVKGAFTGANKDRVGRFEAAHEGSIFLDEIGDMPLPLQVKLLRVLEEKEIERVGEHKPIPVDVRIISATNRNLEELVRQGKFREDLYFRINVFPLRCPSLAERREDIPALVRHFIRQNSKQSGKKIVGVTPEAMERLTTYSWPGNVRELRNAIDYAFVLCPGGAIGIEHLPATISAKQNREAYGFYKTANHEEEKARLLEALRHNGWNQSKTARQLGVSRVTVWKRMKKHGIKRPD